MNPVAAPLISQHPDIIHAFQLSVDGELLHRSSSVATNASEIVDELADLSQAISRKIGMAAVDRISVTGRSEKLMIFGLQSLNADPPGPRVFGMITPPETKMSEMDEFLRSVI